jgi:hypothetical protein
MIRRHLIAGLVLGLSFGVLVILPSRAAEPEADAAKIAKLIEQLGSGNFDQREKATKELGAIGTPALEALRKAAKSEDAEIKLRSADLVKIIEKRAETENTLKPTKVHLVCKDTPIADAVKELKKQTGYTIVLHDPENKLKDRTVTLDTGDTTFWQAIDMLCEKAGIHEVAAQDAFGQGQPGIPGGPPPVRLQPIPVQPAVPIKPKAVDNSLAFEVDQKLVPAPAQPGVAPPPVAPPIGGPGTGIGRPVAPGFGIQSGQVILTDGKVNAQATAYAGAVRIRNYSKPEIFGQAAGGQILLALEVAPEPKITWQRLIGVKVTKALDDNDQKLGESSDANEIGGPGPQAGAIAPGVGRPIAPRPAQQIRGFFQHQVVAVRLTKGEKASKSIKELTGTVSAEVLAESQPLISTDEIMKSAGKTFKGEESGSIKVNSVDRDEASGTVKVVFEFEAPAGAMGAGGVNIQPGLRRLVPLQPAAPPPPPPAEKGPAAPPPAAPPPAALQAAQLKPIPVQGQGPPPVGGPPGAFQVAPGVGTGGVNGLKLVDDKGNAVEGQQIRINQVRQGPGGASIEYALSFPLKKEQTEAGKLTYSASKNVAVEIPFTLKDIVLP